MSLKQFNGNYVGPEDRLMFRFSTVNGEEFRLWLTRRMTQGILAACQTVSVASLAKQHPATTAQAVDSFQKQSLEQSLDFNTSYEPATKLPLGEAPLLVLETRITPIEVNGNPLVDLSFLLPNNHQMSLKLPPQMLSALRLLLEKLQQQAGWLENTTAALPAPALLGPESPSMH